MMDVMKDAISYEAKQCGFTSMEYEPAKKRAILDYMKSFDPFAVAGMVYDCRTGVKLRTENVGYNDGKFMWSEQDIYHIDKYNASVTEEFLKAIT